MVGLGFEFDIDTDIEFDLCFTESTVLQNLVSFLVWKLVLL